MLTYKYKINSISILVLGLLFLIGPIYGEYNTNLTDNEINSNIVSEEIFPTYEDNNKSLSKNNNDFISDMLNEDPHNRKRIRRLNK
ncbi:MAG: hypothetical protein ACI4VU_05400 [Methanobrevibacter sp.]